MMKLFNRPTCGPPFVFATNLKAEKMVVKKTAGTFAIEETGL